MSTIAEATVSFIDAFEVMFNTDWPGTKARLGMLETGSFLEPGATDESTSWGNRDHLLETYRKLEDALAAAGVTTQSQVCQRRSQGRRVIPFVPQSQSMLRPYESKAQPRKKSEPAKRDVLVPYVSPAGHEEPNFPVEAMLRSYEPSSQVDGDEWVPYVPPTPKKRGATR